MTERKRYIAAVLFHAAVLVLECVGFWPNPFNEELIYYTQISNLLALFGAAAYCIDALPRLKRGETAPSPWVRAFNYITVCMLTVTFLVVIFILSPAFKEEGGLRFMMLHGSMLYMHFLCPVLALVSFLFFEKKPPLTKKHLLMALIPTLLYAAVTITLNILKVLEGPYPFLKVYEQPVYMSVIWFFAVLGGAFLIAWGLKKITDRTPSKTTKAEN